jgi:hypothetical protein
MFVDLLDSGLGRSVSLCECGTAVRMLVDLFGSGQGQLVGFSEQGTELLGS